jgi:hypothetical protein
MESCVRDVRRITRKSVQKTVLWPISTKTGACKQILAELASYLEWLHTGRTGTFETAKTLTWSTNTRTRTQERGGSLHLAATTPHTAQAQAVGLLDKQ